MNGILVTLGGKPKMGKGSDSKDDDAKSTDGEPDGDEKATGQEARIEALKAFARASSVKNYEDMDKAMKAWCTAAGYGEADEE